MSDLDFTRKTHRERAIQQLEAGRDKLQLLADDPSHTEHTLAELRALAVTYRDQFDQIPEFPSLPLQDSPASVRLASAWVSEAVTALRLR